jgi:hypothetical protein
MVEIVPVEVLVVGGGGAASRSAIEASKSPKPQLRWMASMAGPEQPRLEWGMNVAWGTLTPGTIGEFTMKIPSGRSIPE